LAVLKTSNIDPGWFSKDLDAAPRNLLSNRSEGFNSPLFKSFGQIEKLWRKTDKNFSYQ
jgi:hypothetical protein